MKNKTDKAAKIKFRTEGIFIISAVILLGGAVGWQIIFGVPLPEPYLYFLLVISLLLNATSSAFTIFYQEIPRSGSLSSIKGGWAIFWGAISLIISIAAAFILILEILKSHTSRI